MVFEKEKTYQVISLHEPRTMKYWIHIITLNKIWQHGKSEFLSFNIWAMHDDSYNSVEPR